MLTMKVLIKRAWSAIYEYVQSELLYSTAVPPDPQQQQQKPPPPLASSFAPLPPDPKFLQQQQQRERVYSFIRVPMSLEKFMLFGFWLCVDTFLTMFTFLPIRFVFGAFNFLSRPLGYIRRNWRREMTPAQRCDFLRGVVIICCSGIVMQLDISVFYHLVRSQSIIKLYIFFNMLEIAEKLMASVGQDIMDALFITANERTLYPKSRSRYLMLSFHVALAIIYSCVHTVIFMLQAVTLNVAFNSQNKSLLTVMMSNNFVEIKSNVFRKYSKNNLYQVACADARERFHLVVMMGIVAARNMAQYNWSLDHLMALLPDMVLVLLAEVFVDWIKHCFITKFNETSSEVYVELRTSLARHVLTASVVSGGADRQDTVANRTGLSLVPISSLVIIVGVQVFRSAAWSITDPIYIAFLVVAVFAFKSVLGYFVISSARTIVVQATQTAAAHNLTPLSHANGRIVGGFNAGRHNRSYSVEDVQLESSKPVAPTPVSLSAKLTNVNNSLKDLSKENIENQKESPIVKVTTPQQPVLAVKQTWRLNELRRTKSIGDLSTIYETSQMNFDDRPNGVVNRKFLFTPTTGFNSNSIGNENDGVNSNNSTNGDCSGGGKSAKLD